MPGGPSTSTGFTVAAGEELTAAALDTLLDTLQAALPGKITVVYDADRPGVFLQGLRDLRVTNRNGWSSRARRPRSPRSS